MRVLPLTLLLAACGGTREPLSDDAIANQAESLERAANATVDQQISEIEADAAKEEVVVPVGNSGNTAGE